MSITKREIVSPGKKDPGPIVPDTKFQYHFRTVVIREPGEERLLIDDSRSKFNKPMETIYGKEFKLPIWESCLKSMKLGEVCKLTIRDDPATHFICLNYVVVSKCFRKHCGIKPDRCHHESESSGMHRCCMAFQDSPYEDLNELIKNPPEMFEFTFELLSIQPPEDYQKDIWQMNDQEKLDILPKLREEGNQYYKECNYERAINCYSKGLGVIDSLMLRERPRDDDWIKLDNMKLPFFLNLAQIKLIQDDYYDCIKYSDEVLNRDPTNIKAFFRRAKAHSGAWNLKDAKKDFKKCLEIDQTMEKVITKLLEELKNKEIVKNNEDRDRLKGKGIFANS